MPSILLPEAVLLPPPSSSPSHRRYRCYPIVFLPPVSPVAPAGLPELEKRRLLSCVVVGGGPTGVEFSGELSDFIRRDVRS